MLVYACFTSDKVNLRVDGQKRNYRQVILLPVLPAAFGDLEKSVFTYLLFLQSASQSMQTRTAKTFPMTSHIRTRRHWMIKIERHGGRKWTSYSPSLALLWIWPMFGDSPISATKMAEVSMPTNKKEGKCHVIPYVA